MADWYKKKGKDGKDGKDGKEGHSAHETPAMRHGRERGEAHQRHSKARDDMNKQHEAELAQMAERHAAEMEAPPTSTAEPAAMNNAGAGAAAGTPPAVAAPNAA